jgi:hypothetical protein
MNSIHRDWQVGVLFGESRKRATSPESMGVKDWSTIYCQLNRGEISSLCIQFSPITSQFNQCRQSGQLKILKQNEFWQLRR